MFDKDGDGRLNTAERKNCAEALASGLEEELKRKQVEVKGILKQKVLRKSKSDAKIGTRVELLQSRKLAWIKAEDEVRKSAEKLKSG